MATDVNRGYFPFQYYEGFLDYLDIYRNDIEVITYNDLEWGDDYNYLENYPDEWSRWKKSLRMGTRDATKVYVVIQHDVDSKPELTDMALEAEAIRQLRSNIMLFNNRVRRKHYQDTGEVTFDTKYQIDFERWKDLAKDGFVFCYHANSFEQSGFDAARSMETFVHDVKELRTHFPIAFFSPHGGARSPEGKSNNSLSIPATLKKEIRWVANGHTPRFDGVFSDGGPNSLKRDPEARDLRDFVRTWKPGGRYRVLTHPQYYSPQCGSSPRLAEAHWYRELIAECKSKSYDSWAGVPPPQSRKRIQS